MQTQDDAGECGGTQENTGERRVTWDAGVTRRGRRTQGRRRGDAGETQGRHRVDAGETQGRRSDSGTGREVIEGVS